MLPCFDDFSSQNQSDRCLLILRLRSLPYPFSHYQKNQIYVDLDHKLLYTQAAIIFSRTRIIDNLAKSNGCEISYPSCKDILLATLCTNPKKGTESRVKDSTGGPTEQQIAEIKAYEKNGRRADELRKRYRYFSYD
jgi:hypothetical protein